MEEKRDPLTQPEAAPGAGNLRDPRPSDLEMFYALLPGVLGSLAAKSPDSASANSMALMMVREMLGQCAAMGILRVETRLLDGSPLAKMPNQGMAPVGTASPVAQYPNQPGMGQPAGGGVQQYPNWGQPAGNGGGNKGVLVAMYPNNNPPPQL
ncbi:MAG TPA: hypothetical protein VFA98_08250 [Thermoanaerobaculia bacterium]|jgi:hypothetical protein|nr:hypothetical protein [Thermoanaerobaculia bacterium]